MKANSSSDRSAIEAPKLAITMVIAAPLSRSRAKSALSSASARPPVNAIAATGYARARTEAKAAETAALRGEPLGALHGLPTGIKDLHETQGLLTTYGSPLYRDFVPRADAAMVALVQRMVAHFAKPSTPYEALPWPEFGPHFNDYEHLERVAEWSTAIGDEE